jgi:hypothetical protein
MVPLRPPQRPPSRVLVLEDPDGNAVRVHLFPSDAHLARDVRLAWGRLVADRADDETFIRDLEATLRRWYPLLSIQRQDQLASTEADERVWYVFRDGALRLTKPWRDALHVALAEARDTRTTVESTILRSLRIMEEAQQRRAEGASRAMARSEPAGSEVAGSERAGSERAGNERVADPRRPGG